MLLGPLAMLLLVMPTSYRAGAEDAHPHPIFQPVIDQIIGRPHHHGEKTTSAAPLPDPRLPDGNHDLPSSTTMKPAPDQPLALVAPGMLLLLAAVTVRRYHSPRVRLPADAVPSLEPPPPRPNTALTLVRP